MAVPRRGSEAVASRLAAVAIRIRPDHAFRNGEAERLGATPGRRRDFEPQELDARGGALEHRDRFEHGQWKPGRPAGVLESGRLQVQRRLLIDAAEVVAKRELRALHADPLDA